ncbi:ribosomal-protein-serine acetyltransferase [Bacillus cereus]|uniref:GNAT family N-acetyltransferase n=1 Tax=Bacillus cereus group TaxID=86661 RepID=UPI000789F501|nr:MULTISPECIES: GNAT family protein [Bacillus cereus group]KYQ00947.1 Ribosomal-protein-L7p-serine acetyltransferase [Bacillus cereus]MED1214311.1 GNAT family protein [Bacillus paranthracis]BCC13986.1 ribosomal-protein-serine acetyltransferase [Bacillus cereus]BCD01511.1 ribosomal-protein-serine acetyltransferase [Bacillus cereus]HDR6307247.1 GNAT family N-acetyltransferase [Bacillus cereus]
MLIHKIDEEISLRMFNEGDSEEFYDLIISSKTYLKEWLGWLDYIESVEDTAQNIKARLKAFAENGGYPQSFAIIYKGDIAGTTGFNDINKTNKIGIVGYWLGEKFQGKGIMTKAFKTLIDYGFKELGLNRIEVSVAVENKKSRALPEGFGFVEEGKVRQAERLYDHYVDHVIYGLLATEWK